MIDFFLRSVRLISPQTAISFHQPPYVFTYYTRQNYILKGVRIKMNHPQLDPMSPNELQRAPIEPQRAPTSPKRAQRAPTSPVEPQRARWGSLGTLALLVGGSP